MGRAPCCEKNGLKKGPWTQEEDQKLIDYISKHGYGNWRTLPKNAELQRCGKSCRLRWTNYLRPDIKRGRFSAEEEETIIQLHRILGNKWSTIAARLPGRTDNEIKNYWNTHIRKRLLRMGIDPVTHSPRLDLLDLSSLYNTSQMNLSTFLAMQHLAANPYILQQNDQIMSQVTQTSQFQAPFSENTQLIEPFLEPFSSNFSTQNCHVNEWESNIMECHDVPALQDHQYVYQAGSDQFVMDSTFQSFLSSNLSTTSSSTPAPVNSTSNSNSTYVTSSSSTEDERETFCSNMFKFEIPHILDVNEFM